MENYKLWASYDRRKIASPTKAAKVEIEIYFNRNERKRIATGIELYSNQWDGEFVVRRPDAKELNRQITKLLKRYEEVIKDLRRNGKEINLANFNSALEISKLETKTSFIDFALDEMQKRGLRYSTLRAHNATIETLRRSKCIETFDDLTSENIARFDQFLRQEDPARAQVTLHNYHKRLKPYVNEALRRGFIEENPYKKFRDIKGKYKERQPLTLYELKQICNLELHDKQLSDVRDQFIFCCYTGLAWVDLLMFDYEKCVVKHEDMYFIDGERIKTGTKFYTPILPPAMQILKEHNYKFKVSTNQAFNRNLKIIAEIIGLKKPLTSHIARHTFATTVVLANEVPVEALSKMLGHTKISVTQIYAKVLNSSVERQAKKLNRIL